MGTVSYSTAQKKARDATRRGDMKAIQNALEQYYANNSQYPGGAFPNGINSSTYFPSGSAPATGPRGEGYTSPTYSTITYKVCCDLEGTGGYTGSQQDFCVYNLQQGGITI